MGHISYSRHAHAKSPPNREQTWLVTALPLRQLGGLTYVLGPWGRWVPRHVSPVVPDRWLYAELTGSLELRASHGSPPPPSGWRRRTNRRSRPSLLGQGRNGCPDLRPGRVPRRVRDHERNSPLRGNPPSLH